MLRRLPLVLRLLVKQAHLLCFQLWLRLGLTRLLVRMLRPQLQQRLLLLVVLRMWVQLRLL